MHTHLHVGVIKSSQYTYWNVLNKWEEAREETLEPRRNPHGHTVDVNMDRNPTQTVTQA